MKTPVVCATISRLFFVIHSCGTDLLFSCSFARRASSLNWQGEGKGEGKGEGEGVLLML